MFVIIMTAIIGILGNIRENKIFLVLFMGLIQIDGMIFFFVLNQINPIDLNVKSQNIQKRAIEYFAIIEMVFLSLSFLIICLKRRTISGNEVNDNSI
jgi:hypothetical protein